MIHARIQEFSSGGGGGGGRGSIWHIKKSSDNVFFLLYFLVLNLFYSSQVVTFKETIICQGSSGGGIFPRGSNFLQGVQLLFANRNPYNL